MRYALPWVTVLGALALGAGCAKTDQIEPAPGAQEVNEMQDAAMVTVDGVQVIAQPGEWPGEREVLDHVTPVFVTMMNQSGLPLRIEYRHFALVTPGGQRLSVLPPFDIKGAPLRPRLVRSPNDDDLEFGYESKLFRVAPVYAPLYSGLEADARPFAVRPDYYANTYGYWTARTADKKPLPTRAMRVVALPEGIIDPEGYVQGFLYFPELPSNTSGVEFRARIIDANTGDVFAVARVPFEVE